MKYIIVNFENDLDSIIAMYMYYKFIEFAGFKVKCYLVKKMDKKTIQFLKENHIKLCLEEKIEDDSCIILLKKSKKKLSEHLVNENVTEIISLVDDDFSNYIDANIVIGEVDLLSTIMIERYREYNIELFKESISLLNILYQQKNLNLTKRDEIAKEYVDIIQEK